MKKKKKQSLADAPSFGEAVIMIANDPKTLGITDFFKTFYNGFPETSTIWFAYHDEKVVYKNPFKFQLDSWKTDKNALEIMKEIISPRILPVNFTAGKDVPSYEFYNPSWRPDNWDLAKCPLFFSSLAKFSSEELLTTPSLMVD